MLEAFVRGRIVQHKGCVEGIADQFDIDGRVVPVALNFLDIEPRGPNGILHDLDVGALLGIQRLRIEFFDARLDVALQLDLRLDAGGAEIIQLVFEHLAVMAMIADGARRDRRQRQTAEDKIIHDLAELQVCGRRTGQL